MHNRKAPQVQPPPPLKRGNTHTIEKWRGCRQQGHLPSSSMATGSESSSPDRRQRCHLARRSSLGSD